MSTTLPDSVRALWEQYIRTENSGTRDAKMMELRSFIDALLQCPLSTRTDWVLEVAKEVVDTKSDITIRRPLFERVIFPVLADALDAKVPGSARWLAGFSEHLYRSNECIRRLGSIGEWDLLRIALEQDPADADSRQRLIDSLAKHLRYTLHELPTGVLYTQDGATIDECDALLAEVEELKTLTVDANCTQEFAALIADCDFHYNSYKRYLLALPVDQSYSQFLNNTRRDQ